MNKPPPCLTVGMVFLGWFRCHYFFRKTYFESLWPNSSIFVSSDHSTLLQYEKGFSRLSLEYFIRFFKWHGFNNGVLRGRKTELCSVQNIGHSRKTDLYTWLVITYNSSLNSLSGNCGVFMYLFNNSSCSSLINFAWPSSP